MEWLTTYLMAKLVCLEGNHMGEFIKPIVMAKLVKVNGMVNQFSH